MRENREWVSDIQFVQNVENLNHLECTAPRRTRRYSSWLVTWLVVLVSAQRSFTQAAQAAQAQASSFEANNITWKMLRERSICKYTTPPKRLVLLS